MLEAEGPGARQVRAAAAVGQVEARDAQAHSGGFVGGPGFGRDVAQVQLGQAPRGRQCHACHRVGGAPHALGGGLAAAQRAIPQQIDLNIGSPVVAPGRDTQVRVLERHARGLGRERL